MRVWSSTAPTGAGSTVYFVLDDLGRLGKVWREVDADSSDFETVINNLLSGQYSDPVRVVAFNTNENWAKDVSAETARELLDQSDMRRSDVPDCLKEFVAHHNKPMRDKQLRLRVAQTGVTR